VQKEDCFLLGYISRLHGLNGELIAVFDTDQPERYIELESVFVETHGELVPFFISTIQQNSKGHFIIRFEDVDKDQASEMTGRELWLPLSLLPPLSGKNFYFHEVIGFRVNDTQHGPLGACIGIIETAAQPLFQIQSKETEILIPAIDEIIQNIDRQNHEILVTCPEGLIELYLYQKPS
jgi:16S rRNA processing protein RimM